MFRIQVNSPKLIKVNFNGDSIQELIEDSFLLETENLIMYWNYTPISLDYKYDVSVIFPTVLEMLEQLLNNNSNINVNWFSDNFNGSWNILIKDNGNIQILSTWNNIVGKHIDVLNSDNILNTTLESFCKEWNSLLTHLLEIFELNELKINSNEIIRVKRIVNEIGDVGEIYL